MRMVLLIRLISAYARPMLQEGGLMADVGGLKAEKRAVMQKFTLAGKSFIL